ncbi:tRNA threonylcarbamoyladenosine dehydratase, partial [Lecanoromycetidae sp. Uapishka_2]
MASWFDRQFANKNVQLAAVALLSGAAVAGTIYGTQAIRRKERVEELKASIPELNETHHATMLTNFGAAAPLPAASKEDERAAALARRAQHDLVAEQLTRTASFLGPDRFTLLRDSFVVVVGLGGVGSHCTSALARSGISHIRLIDFDQVTLSSLNRHAVAALADVGTPKVECVRRRLQAVVPWVKWECFNEVWKQDQAETLLAPWDKGKGRKPNYVVDAIDNIDSKVALLQYCHEHDIKVVSSMGAGCKSDPTRVQVGDISASVEDPLSRVTRRKLRAAGVSDGIPVVFSTEKPGPGKAELLPLPDEEFQKGKVNELSVLPDFRARILPVLGTMPAVFGYTVANFIICEITGYPHESGAGKLRDKMYENILSTLQGTEERLVRQAGADALGLKIPVSKDDVGYLVEEVYRGKSVISKVPTRLALVRWKAPEDGFRIEEISKDQKRVKLELTDLVLMTKEEAAMHEKEVLKGGKAPESMYSKEVLDLVERRRDEERHYQQYR